MAALVAAINALLLAQKEVDVRASPPIKVAK
jgi:hypothetical protein